MLAMWCVGLQLQYGKFALSIATFILKNNKNR